MATNRTRTRRPRKVEMSEQLLATFMRQQTLMQKYVACMRKVACGKPRATATVTTAASALYSPKSCAIWPATCRSGRPMASPMNRNRHRL